MVHKPVATGYTILSGDDGWCLEAPGGAALTGPRLTPPGSAFPAFSVRVAAAGAQPVDVTLQAGQTVLGSGATTITIPGNEARDLTLLSGGKWVVK